MKSPRKFTGNALCLALLLGAGFLLTGCQMGSKPVFASLPDTSPDAAAPAAAPAAVQPGNKFQVGDLVTVNFSGLENTIPPHEERIKEDGTITLPLINQVKAVNQTPGELQRAIHDFYVPKYYRNITITVQSQNQYFYVGGEVKGANRYPYLGETTVLKAVQAAGDFTDFANKRKVRLTHGNGQTVIVNCLKAIEDTSLDLPVYPGDKIYVPRRLW